jgi:histidine triad (HIT) family protein
MSESTSNDCIFCKIVSREIPSVKILETERALVFADINPATRGHALVVPKTHSVNILDVSEEDAIAVMEAARSVARAMPQSLGCRGVNLFHCAGKEAWQDVFHFHLHVIPRYAKQELTQAWTVKPGDPRDIEEAAAALRSAL